MKRTKCVVCNAAQGKRFCHLNNSALICSLCCAKSRNPDCFGCRYYDQAERFSLEKEEGKEIYKQQKILGEDNFIIEINEEVEENVDAALVLVEQGKIAQGESIIKKLYRKHPLNHIVLYAMGVVNIFKGDKKQALLFFDKAVEIFPPFYEAWLNKGVIHQENYEIPDMVEAFRKVVKYGDKNEREVRKIKKALSDLDKTTQKTDNLTLDEYIQNHRRYDKAFKLMKMGHLQRAINGFKQVIEVCPSHTQSYGNMGLCYAILGEKQKALEAFNKALELDPNYEPAAFNREALLKMKEGENFSDIKPFEVDFYKDGFSKKKSILKK